MGQFTVSSRAAQLLKILIERYILDGQPVGSKTLAKELNLSPATIRNVMADLEEQGLLISPHTSSGRIPTAQGYRLFVDTLVSVKSLEQKEITTVAVELGQSANNVPLVIESASALLSNFTSLAGLVSMPRREQSILKLIEFVPLSDNRVLAIVVFNDTEIQNRIIYTDRAYTRDELQTAANFINSQYSNTDLNDIRDSMFQSMQRDRERMNELMSSALAMADQALQSTGKNEDYVIAGQANLLDLAESAGIEKLRKVFDAFSEKQQIVHLLDKCLATDGVQIFIGDESGYSIFDQCSVVGAPYKVDGKVVGVLGVIGPTRMAYDRVIPVVDITAKLLSQTLGAKDKS